MSNKTYNGYTNYETWAVNLWMNNEQGSYNYWAEAAKDAWEETRDHYPNQFMNHVDNARTLLAACLKDEHDDQSEHPVFAAADNSVYADLLNAALSEVNWREIAQGLIDSYLEVKPYDDDAIIEEALRRAEIDAGIWRDS